MENLLRPLAWTYLAADILATLIIWLNFAQAKVPVVVASVTVDHHTFMNWPLGSESGCCFSRWSSLRP